jgi:hypothetical protein
MQSAFHGLSTACQDQTIAANKDDRTAALKNPARFSGLNRAGAKAKKSLPLLRRKHLERPRREISPDRAKTVRETIPGNFSRRFLPTARK